MQNGDLSPGPDSNRDRVLGFGTWSLGLGSFTRNDIQAGTIL